MTHGGAAGPDAEASGEDPRAMPIEWLILAGPRSLALVECCGHQWNSVVERRRSARAGSAAGSGVS
jgi:hypothetical protein